MPFFKTVEFWSDKWIAKPLPKGYQTTQSKYLYVYMYSDTVLKDNLKKAFALVASLGIGVSWGMIQTMSTELYPTVVRYT